MSDTDGSDSGAAGQTRDRTRDRVQEIADLERLADLMDSRFRVPGTDIRFGLDAVLGLVPGVGDGLVSLPGVYIIVRAHRMGAPFLLLSRMALNLTIDLVVGAIPLLGDLFDVGFRANRRNVALLRRHFSRAASPEMSSRM